VDLSRDGRLVHLAHSGEMVLEVDRGRIRVQRARCHRKICQQQGFIGTPFASIVCVPARVLIVIAGREDQERWDALAY
jgi:hypothetical protein